LFSELEQLFQRLTPEILLAVLIGAGIIAFLLVLLLNRYRSRLRLRIFLYKPLPCTVDRMRFLRSKSLFDILIDMGLSKKALDYLYKELGWIPSEGVLGHIDLNTKVSDSVAQYGNYESFITHSKAQLQGFPKNSLPEVQSRAVSLDRRPILDEPSPDKSLAIEKIMEERRVFNSMFICKTIGYHTPF
jgi:hypothetical protein